MFKQIKLNKNLSLLLGGQLISQIGDKLYAIALSYWILKETGSSSIMGFYLFCSIFPSVLAGFFSGGIIDKLNRKMILVATDIIRGFLILIITIAFYCNILSLWLIILTQIFLSLSQAFFNPTVLSVLPQIVEKDALAKANAKSQLISGITLIAGPVLGGITVAAAGYGSAFIANSLSFFISAIMEVFLVLKINISDKTPNSLIKDIITGYKYILKSTQIIVISIIVAILHFFVGSIQVIMPVFANSISGNGARNLGFIEMFFGMGVVITAFYLSAKGIKSSDKLMFKAIFFLGINITIFGSLRFIALQVIAPYLFVFSLFSCCVICISTCYQSILQKNIENSMAGRVFSVIGSIGNSTLPLASLIFGFMLNSFKDYYLLIFCGVVIIILSILLQRFYKAKVKIL